MTGHTSGSLISFDHDLNLITQPSPSLLLIGIIGLLFHVSHFFINQTSACLEPLRTRRGLEAD